MSSQKKLSIWRKDTMNFKKALFTLATLGLVGPCLATEPAAEANQPYFQRIITTAQTQLFVKSNELDPNHKEMSKWLTPDEVANYDNLALQSLYDNYGFDLRPASKNPFVVVDPDLPPIYGIPQGVGAIALYADLAHTQLIGVFYPQAEDLNRERGQGEYVTGDTINPENNGVIGVHKVSVGSLFYIVTPIQGEIPNNPNQKYSQGNLFAYNRLMFVADSAPDGVRPGPFREDFLEVDNNWLNVQFADINGQRGFALYQKIYPINEKTKEPDLSIEGNSFSVTGFDVYSTNPLQYTLKIAGTYRFVTWPDQ